MKWFEWISLFKALVHDAGQSPAEKLAIRKHNLKRDCKKLTQGFGEGEPEYKEALRRLKQECGQRDVLRIGHLPKRNTLHPGKGDAISFRKFAEDAKSHVFDFGRLGGDYLGDVIENLNLTSQQDNVELLLGVDHPLLMAPKEIRRGKEQEPYVIRTNLGWIARGLVGENLIENHANIN